MGLGDLSQCFRDGAASADTLKPRRPVEQGLKSLAHGLVVFHNGDLDHNNLSGSGAWKRTVVPFCPWLVISHRPPSVSNRAFMLAMPSSPAARSPKANPQPSSDTSTSRLPSRTET